MSNLQITVHDLHMLRDYDIWLKIVTMSSSLINCAIPSINATCKQNGGEIEDQQGKLASQCWYCCYCVCTIRQEVAACVANIPPDSLLYFNKFRLKPSKLLKQLTRGWDWATQSSPAQNAEYGLFDEILKVLEQIVNCTNVHLIFWMAK